MTDIPVPQEAPRQPHIDRAEWKGSTTEIYEPSELFSRAQSEAIQLFDRSDFETPIERATFSLEPVQTEQGEPAVGIAGIIQLDRSRSDLRQLVDKFKKVTKPYGGKDNGLRIAETPFSNVFVLEDGENPGAKATVAIYDTGEIRITGQNSHKNDNGKEVTVRAPAAEAVDGAAVLRGAARIFMRTLDFANGSHTYKGYEPLNRTYSIGEVIKPARQTLTRTIGQTAVSKTAAVRSPRSPGRGQEAPVEQLGIDIMEGKVTLNDIGGLESVKAKLGDIAVSFSHPEVMAKWGAERPQGVLLYGEPGTGKTMLVEALANEIGADVWKVQGSDIYNMWLGESERKVKELFNKARAVKAPTILFFDEIDSIIGTSETPGPGGGGQSRNAVAGIFKQELNTLADENPNLLICAATNDLDRMDPALIRSGRFDHKIYVPMPSEHGRAEIISGIIGKAIITNDGADFNPYGGDINATALAEVTDGMSGADITEIFRRISLQKAMQEARTGAADPIMQEDILRTIRDFKTEG